VDNLDSGKRPIKRALVSVWDKTGLVSLAQALHNAGVEIVSTGSTAGAIAAAGIPVTKVEQVTGFPEILDGRVKTLHPHIHGGLLADTRNPAHTAQLAEHNIAPFDLVVGNLYPFIDALGTGKSDAEMVELIDIGGPTMIRAAAKNHAVVAVVTDPAQYGSVVAALAAGGFTEAERRQLAAAVFATTSAYDAEIATWLTGSSVEQQPIPSVEERKRLETLGLSSAAPVETTGLPEIHGATELRYGENPHQAAWLIPSQAQGDGLAHAQQLGGKPMSYNNYVDADAAWRAALDHDLPAVAIIKHANPCGIAVGHDIAEAYRLAHATDPLSAYGGVVAANRQVTAEMARDLAPVFTEVVIAPSYVDEALEILQSKKNLRILQMSSGKPEAWVEKRNISGGTLVQEADQYQADGDSPETWTQVAGPQVDPQTLADLAFAWRAVRAAKSNAILLARGGAAVGVGMGQVNRVDAAKLAVNRANELVEGGAGGAVAASDAFFPFADGLQILIDAGVNAVVQPGGSIRDDEVIAAAEAAEVPMFFTGVRHFAH
jgi:phosphoribosylaminoimidazolecarboxamide formyltransferase/IMP cyclohydrolase